jgi:hypothetical protein
VSARTSSPKAALSEEQVQAKLVQAWARTIATVGKGAFADKAGCHPDTISNALSGAHMPKLHTVLNSLLACPNALDELLALYGFRIVPDETALSPDMVTLHCMSRAMSEFIEALSDGKRTHRETLELAEEIRPLVPRLVQIIHEADGLKAA